MGTKDVYNHAKKGQLIFKKTMAIFKIQMHKKSFFENVFDLTSFSQDLGLFFLDFFFFGYIFFRTLFPVILLPDTLFATSHTILGKKVAGIQNRGLLFSVTFFLRT